MKAFTLIELVLVIALSAFLLGGGAVIYSRMQQDSDLQANTQLTLQAVSLARSNTAGAFVDSGWGVYFQGQQVIVFQGNNYASRNTTYDVQFSLLGNYTLSGTNEITFSKNNLKPNTGGSITISNGNLSQILTINALGTVEY